MCLIITIIVLIDNDIVNAVENDIKTYKSYVDMEFGFYRVIDITTLKPTNYEGRTLTINLGDTVTWINDDNNGSITIISEEDIWNAEDSFLGNEDTFSYTFENPGKYIIYIQEDPTIRQTILVNDTVENDQSDNIEDITGGNIIYDDTNIEEMTGDNITHDDTNNNENNISINNSFVTKTDNNENNISINNSFVTKTDNKDHNIFKFIEIIIIILMVFCIRIISVLMIYRLGKILK